LKALGRLSVIYLFIAMFWALFDQTGSSWVLQAEHMDRTVLGYNILPSQMQAANPLLMTAIMFAVVARFYSGKRHLHRETQG